MATWTVLRKKAKILLLIVPIILMASGLFILYQIWYFYYRSSHVGAQISARESLAIKQAQKSLAPGSCIPPTENDSNPQPAGILSIPSIGLFNAPVVQGTTDAQLNVAIGHDPLSVWPGQAGTSVLSAHDVTWFSKLPEVKPGDKIIYETPCATYTFQAGKSEIVRAGIEPPESSDATLILDTCWPITALYLTNQRFLLNATLVEFTPHGTSVGPALRSHVEIKINAPVSLASSAQLIFPYLPFVLSNYELKGNPSGAWQQSTGPTDVELLVLQLYQDGIYTLENQRPDWWSDIAPNVSYATGGPLIGAKIRYLASISPEVFINQTQLISAQITTVIEITGGSAPGTYKLNVTEAVSKNTLSISSWNLSKTS